MAPEKQTVEHLLERLIEEEGLLHADEEAEAVAFAAITIRKGKVAQKEKSENDSSKRRNKKMSSALNFIIKDIMPVSVLRRKRKKRKSPPKNLAFVAEKRPDSKNELGIEESSWKPARELERLLEADVNDVCFTDSGSSSHLTHRKDWFVEYTPRRDGASVTTASVLLPAKVRSEFRV